MCAGMEFCGDCRNDAVEAWAHGHSHALPTFGDDAQRYTAARIRGRLIADLQEIGNVTELNQFPEWNYAEGRTHRVPVVAWHSRYFLLIERRRGVVTSLIRAGNVAALAEFPEWHAALGILRLETAGTLGEIVAKLPSDRTRPSSGASRRRKAKYRRALNKWTRSYGGAYNSLLQNVLRQVGYASAKVDSVELAAAAA